MNLQGPTFELASAARSGLRRLRLFHELEDAMMECAHLVFPPITKNVIDTAAGIRYLVF